MPKSLAYNMSNLPQIVLAVLLCTLVTGFSPLIPKSTSLLPRRFLQLASKPHSPRSFLLRSASLDSNSDADPQDTTIPSASDDSSNVEGVFEGEIWNSIAEVGGEPQREDSIANDDDQQGKYDTEIGMMLEA